MDKIYKFGEFYLDTNSKTLLHRKNLTRLSPRACNILLHLIENQGKTVIKEDLINSVWNDSYVEENNLPVHISALRRVLREKEPNVKYIETISGRGYSFIQRVSLINADTYTALSEEIPSETNQINSIAILPFINRNNNPNLDYLAEGITDSLISSLSNISQLKIIAYSAVLQFKNNQSNLKDIGFLLNVESILVGSIFEYDGTLEISVELVKISNLSRLWGTQYQCKLENLFKTKTEISIAITDKLQIQLSKYEEQQLIGYSTESTEAYQFYLKGRHFIEPRTKHSLLKAIGCFRKALEIDPNFVLPYSDIAYCYVVLANSFFIPVNEAIKNAKYAIKNALILDKNLSEVHASNGFLQLFELDLKRSQESFETAIKLNSNSTFANTCYSTYLMAMGDFGASLYHHYKSMELSPQIWLHAGLSAKLMVMGEFQKAIENSKECLELFSNRSFVHYGMAFSYVHLNMFDSAIKNANYAIDMTPATENVALLGYIYAESGNHSDSVKLLNELIDNYENQPVDFYDIAIIYSALGNNDKAFEYFEKAYDSKFTHLFLLKVDPRCKSLHSDTRFFQMLQKIGLV